MKKPTRRVQFKRWWRSRFGKWKLVKGENEYTWVSVPRWTWYVVWPFWKVRVFGRRVRSAWRYDRGS